MYLVIGLGNDFMQYQYTRHNIGFLILDQIATEYNLNFALKKNVRSHIACFKLDEIFNNKGLNLQEKIIFAKPNQYMNNSGLSIPSLSLEYKPKKIIVLHDELDLKFGEIKYKLGGSDNGHNGLKSISNQIGSNYYKVRIGIGRPNILNSQEDSMFENILKKTNNIKPDISSYVLANFTKEELIAVQNKTKQILLILEKIIQL